MPIHSHNVMRCQRPSFERRGSFFEAGREMRTIGLVCELPNAEIAPEDEPGTTSFV
jgi:hypothetical protein